MLDANQTPIPCNRYEFKSGQRVALQEMGPRFTLKLRWLQNGLFDTKYGEYEWILKVITRNGCSYIKRVRLMDFKMN